MADSPINERYLDEITDGDAGFKAELMKDYISATEELLADLQHAQVCSDCAQASKFAHTLKGSSRGIGCDRLGSLAYELEILTRNQEHERCLSLFDQIEAEFHLVKSWWESASGKAA